MGCLHVLKTLQRKQKHSFARYNRSLNFVLIFLLSLSVFVFFLLQRYNHRRARIRLVQVGTDWLTQPRMLFLIGL
ncbi:hypothetical protein N665_0119s0075 [Sinapis alba]|nr:hypothetical protein N665_0119s0075 [Sinapis alba]